MARKALTTGEAKGSTVDLIRHLSVRVAFEPSIRHASCDPNVLVAGKQCNMGI
jgi:hypothetical protein